MGKRKRLDLVLVERGLVASREEGRRRIMAGHVCVDDRPITKAGALIDVHSPIRVKALSPYVSRGGLKLEKALSEFAIEVQDKTAIDIGASTGGFTDCLLARGAARVFAVDVGYGQLAWKLRCDPRVLIFEKTNVRHLDPARLPRLADLAVIDASFISLKLILPQVKKLVCDDADVVALIKPQFEVGRGKVCKGGVVRSEEEHRRVVEEIKTAASESGYEARGVLESPLLGPKGNKEFFIHLRRSGPGR
jgi:23S rRNA (cytidine1920-2'-O)/16S rRNA (cytidine1409-2'-O)-methyltransferase